MPQRTDNIIPVSKPLAEQVNPPLINHAFDEIAIITYARKPVYNPVPEELRNFRFKWMQKIVNFIFQEAD